jgi:glucose 1-dehydrogenase
LPEAGIWHNEVALVTGASGSIGAAIVARLESLGARVEASDLDVDVTKASAVDSWVAATVEQWGAPTIGIVCAGISKDGRLAELRDDDWDDVMAVNLSGAFYTARAVVRAMLAGGNGGRIVFVGSWAAQAPHPHIGAYSPSKAGLRALCRTLALDHARDGILVNEVAPGIVDAGLSRVLFERDAALKRRALAAIPIGRIASPEDVARDVCFLASPENRHTTGAVLVSDGGLSLASVMNPGTFH